MIGTALLFLGFITTATVILYAFTPRLHWSKVVAPLALIVLIGWGVTFFDRFSGSPRYDFSAVEHEDTRLLAYRLDEPTYIYLWLDTPVPTAYVLDWDDKLAKKMHKMGQEIGDGKSLYMDKKAGVWQPRVDHDLPQTQEAAKG